MDQVQLADLPVANHPLLHQRVSLQELVRLTLVTTIVNIKEVPCEGLLLFKLFSSHNNLLHVDGMLDLLVMLIEVVLPLAVCNFILVRLLIKFIINEFHEEVSRPSTG